MRVDFPPILGPVSSKHRGEAPSFDPWSHPRLTSLGMNSSLPKVLTTQAWRLATSLMKGVASVEGGSTVGRHMTPRDPLHNKKRFLFNWSPTSEKQSSTNQISRTANGQTSFSNNFFEKIEIKNLAKCGNYQISFQDTVIGHRQWHCECCFQFHTWKGVSRRFWHC